MDTLTKKNVELNLITERLTANLAIEQIFLYCYAINGHPIRQLYVLLQNSTGQSLHTARALCDITLADNPTYRCHVALPEEVNKKIKEGNLRATLICQPANMIFEHSEIKNPIKAPKPDYAAWHERAERFFEKEISKILAFEEGYALYLEKKNYTQAAFMLHQVLELGFRLAEILVIGKEKISHSLRNHQEYIAPFCLELGKLFHRKDELTALGKLDKAYKAARYQHDFKLTTDDLAIGFAKAKALIGYLTALHEALLHEIQRQQNLGDTDKTTAGPAEAVPAAKQNPPNTNDLLETPTSTPDRESIIAALKACCTPTFVSCFAYEREEAQNSNLISFGQACTKKCAYYLFIAYDGIKVETDNLVSAVKRQLPEHIELTLVMERDDLVCKQYCKGHPFFVHLLAQTDVWHQTDPITSLLQNPVATKKHEPSYLLKQWERRHHNALNLYRAHIEDWYIGGEEVVFFTLSQALEQACLGVIACLYGYRPTKVGINYLVQLCKVVVPDAWQALCLESIEQRRFFNMLVEAQYEFRHNANYRAEGFYIQQLQERVKLFIDRCDEAVRSQLEAVIPHELETIA